MPQDLQENAGRRLLEVARTIERAALLDRPARVLSTRVDAKLSPPALRKLLRGTWLGHSLHPLLTDFTEGFWMAASFLDLFGPPGSAPAARRLLGFGLATAVPTYLSGLVDWAAVRREEERRVGLAHLASISLALGLQGGSYLARAMGRQRQAAGLAVAGGIVAFLDGYLGGHLGHVRGVDVTSSDR